MSPVSKVTMEGDLLWECFERSPLPAAGARREWWADLRGDWLWDSRHASSASRFRSTQLQGDRSWDTVRSPVMG